LPKSGMSEWVLILTRTRAANGSVLLCAPVFVLNIAERATSLPARYGNPRPSVSFTPFNGVIQNLLTNPQKLQRENVGMKLLLKLMQYGGLSRKLARIEMSSI